MDLKYRFGCEFFRHAFAFPHQSDLGKCTSRPVAAISGRKPSVASPLIATDNQRSCPGATALGSTIRGSTGSAAPSAIHWPAPRPCPFPRGRDGASVWPSIVHDGGRARCSGWLEPSRCLSGSGAGAEATPPRGPAVGCSPVPSLGWEPAARVRLARVEDARRTLRAVHGRAEDQADLVDKRGAQECAVRPAALEQQALHAELPVQDLQGQAEVQPCLTGKDIGHALSAETRQVRVGDLFGKD
jgi:hypothetical protein